MKRNILWLLLFAILYFVPRTPYLLNPLHGEEGDFAEIFYTQPANPNYLLIGRIDNTNLFIPPEHPAIIYEILSDYGLLWKAIINYQTLTILALTFFVRLAFSMFLFLIVAIIILMILHRRALFSLKDRITLFVLVTVLAITPPAMAISTSVQVDGSVGILLAGLLAVALLGYRLKIYPARTASIFVFISSLLFGLGKNEWSLALVLALLATGSYLYITTRKNGDGQSFNAAWVLLGFIFAGLLLGNFISYLYDPENYLAGFNVMFRISKASTYNIISFGSERLAFTYVHLLLLAFIAIALIRAWKNSDYILFSYFILGATLYFAYFVTSWAIEPRYYAASLIICLAGTVVAYGYLSGDKTRWILWGLSFVLLIVTCNQVVQDGRRIRVNLQLALQNNTNSQVAAIPPGCIPIMGMGEAFGQKFDFIADSLSPEDASRLAAKYNRSICTP